MITSQINRLCTTALKEILSANVILNGIDAIDNPVSFCAYIVQPF